MTVFNAPGFANSSKNQDFFAKLGGFIPPNGPMAGVNNVIADEAKLGDQPWSPVAGSRSRPGAHVNISIENQWRSDETDPFQPALNHSQTALTDSLAVYRLLTTLGTSLTPADYKTILGAAAAGTAASYERVIDAMEKLLGINSQFMPVGNNQNQREALHEGIAGLQAEINRRTLAGAVSILPIATIDPLSLV